MNLACRLPVFLGVILSAGSLCYGATVTGTVKSPDGQPFAGAFVQAQNTKTRITTIAVSDSQGHYRADGLQVGDYRMQVRAVGYRADPQTGVHVTDGRNAPLDFALQKSAVRWNDLSIYQAGKLLPAATGKNILFRNCFICHGFQTRMASVTRDEDGWRDRVEYMRTAMRDALTRFTDQNESDVASYLTSMFGPESVLPKSPADMPEYKETLRTSAATATNITYVEYDMPGPSRMPFSAAPAKDGSVWIPNFGVANKITRLDPDTGAMQDFPVPNVGTASVHSAFPAPDGSVWLAEQGPDKVGHWDPATQKITEYQDGYLPDKDGHVEAGEKHTVRLDPEGNVWATGSPLSRFDPETRKFTRFEQIPHLYTLALDKNGNFWFTKHDTSQIGKVNWKTLQITLYTPPNHNVPLLGVQPNKDGSIRSYPRRLLVDSDGIVWFGEFNAGYLERFDAATETFKEYPLPGPEATPYGLGLDAQNYIWYSSYNQDVLGRFDPQTGSVVEYPFPHSENTIREFFLDAQGRMWYGSPANNKVGYFYLTHAAGGDEHAGKGN